MRIMLVDDELFFIEALKTLINRFQNECGLDVCVIAEFYDGREALAAIPEMKPDAVFTDIRMLSMDGIQLADQIHHLWPNLHVVIISGYPSFEYAREAMRANVADYLLKPIDPNAFRNLLNKLYLRIHQQKYLDDKSLFLELVNTDDPKLTLNLIRQQKLVFPSYFVLIVQNRERPFAFEPPFGSQEHAHEAYLSIIRSLLEFNECIWVLPVNRKREIIILLGFTKYREDFINCILKETMQYFSRNEIPLTIAYSEKMDDLIHLKQVLRQLEDVFIQNLVIGKSNIVSFIDNEKQKNQIFTVTSKQYESKISALISKKDWRSFKTELNQLFKVWKSESCPNLYMEQSLKKILRIFQNEAYLDIMNLKNLESGIEELLYTAVSFEEAHEMLWDLMDHLLINRNRESSEITEMHTLFSKIKAYLISNISEPITLRQLIDIFGVSHTHLCNLFRKNTSTSFVEYFTALRIDKAKELIRNHPDMLLKDVSELIGYNDYQYFCKVFKIVVGNTPTEYKSQKE